MVRDSCFTLSFTFSAMYSQALLHAAWLSGPFPQDLVDAAAAVVRPSFVMERHGNPTQILPGLSF